MNIDEVPLQTISASFLVVIIRAPFPAIHCKSSVASLLVGFSFLSGAQSEHDGLKSLYDWTACLPTGTESHADGVVDNLLFTKSP